MSTCTIYLLSILLLIGFSIVVLRVIVRRDYLRRGHLSIASAALQALVFFLFGGFPAIYLSGDWPISHVILVLRIIGVTSVTIGLGIMFVSILRLGFLRYLGMQSVVLKKTSVYRLTRNPQVLGCLLYVIGFTILWPSLYALGWGLSLTAILHVMVLTEEEHLHNTYGQAYEGYSRNVPRYLGYPKVIK